MKLSWVKSCLRMSVAAGMLGASAMAMSAVAEEMDFGPVKPIEFDAKKAELGKRLFFDVRLSGDAAISCATCHQPDKAFTDGVALSQAYPGSKGFRNTPTLMNTAMRKNWFHDGRLGTNLNDVTRESITETYLMNMDMRLMQERIKQDPVYVQMFKDAGMGEPSNGGVRNAIPEYLKSLTSRNSPFDKGEMSEAANRGFELFKGKAGCAACHTGPNFTDDKAHNIGAPENPEIWSDPMRHMTYTAFASFMGIENYMNLRRDVGAHVRWHKADRSDYGQFITPTLRELTHTAPYMHNGMIATLADVVAFYNAGGGDDPNKSPELKPLDLSASEQQDLVAFLEALSGDLLNGPDHVWQDAIPTEYPSIDDWRNQTN